MYRLIEFEVVDMTIDSETGETLTFFDCYLTEPIAEPFEAVHRQKLPHGLMAHEAAGEHFIGILDKHAGTPDHAICWVEAHGTAEFFDLCERIVMDDAVINGLVW